MLATSSALLHRQVAAVAVGDRLQPEPRRVDVLADGAGRQVVEPLGDRPEPSLQAGHWPQDST